MKIFDKGLIAMCGGVLVFVVAKYVVSNIFMQIVAGISFIVGLGLMYKGRKH